MKTQSKKLKVPYVKQVNNDACGAAALEMIYKFYGLNSISQREIFNMYKSLDDEGFKTLSMSTDSLVEDAEDRGFVSAWARVDWKNKAKTIKIVKRFIDWGVPIIACQQSELNKKLGHFNVVLGYDSKNIYIHDPDKDNSGKPLKLSNEQFVKLWAKTGDNVTGGVFAFII